MGTMYIKSTTYIHKIVDKTYIQCTYNFVIM